MIKIHEDRKNQNRQSSKGKEYAEPIKPKDLQKRGERTKAEAENVEDKIDEALGDQKDVNDLIDEIDAVLESDAESFIRNYVQRGGQ